MTNAADFAAKLKALTDDYAAKLPAKLDEIEEKWQQILQGRWDEENFHTLHRMVHSLTGSGKSYGFSALSDVARTLEIYLKGIEEAKSVTDPEQRAHIEGLMAELRQVTIHRDILHADRQDAISIETASPVAVQSRRILIVDDDLDFANGLKDQLSYFGYEVHVFNRLDDLRNALREARRPAIVMDISFPENSGNGLDLMAEAQRESDTAVPVIYLSMHDEFKSRLAAVRAGGIAYFNKAISVSSLIDKLDELTLPRPATPYRVMIVDDSPAITAYFASVLEGAGMVTSVTNDPLKIMEPLADFAPDLILIDMYMPGCNGMELAKVIRQIESFVSIPIVFLSAEKNLDKQFSAVGLGGDDFLTKPIEPKHLVASVSSRIRRSLLLRSFMVRDSLTGLLNHTTIKDRLSHEVAQAKRNASPFSFAMVDIDHFKQVNDTYGHPVGDKVIKSLSRLLKQRLRENDSVGRYGGEEFAVILSDTNGEAAVKVLETIREDFSQLRHLADGKEFSVTFSCGVADGLKFEDATDLNDAADKALYQAKREGRNRIMLASVPRCRKNYD